MMADYKLYHGDCLEVMQRLIDDGVQVDAVITDPPYIDKVVNGARSRNDGEHGGKGLGIDFCIGETDLRSAFSLSASLCNTWMIATMDYQTGVFYEVNPPLDMDFVRAGVWIKTNSAPQFTGDRPSQGWEFIAIMHKSGIKKKWNGGGKRAVWTTSVSVKNGHPTPKPTKLIRLLLADFTSPGATILDPFMGSGTTSVACAQLNRNFIGIEIDEDYFKIAEERVRTAYMQKVMF